MVLLGSSLFSVLIIVGISSQFITPVGFADVPKNNYNFRIKSDFLAPSGFSPTTYVVLPEMLNFETNTTFSTSSNAYLSNLNMLGSYMVKLTPSDLYNKGSNNSASQLINPQPGTH